jgi:hypothetical protein
MYFTLTPACIKSHSLKRGARIVCTLSHSGRQQPPPSNPDHDVSGCVPLIITLQGCWVGGLTESMHETRLKTSLRERQILIFCGALCVFVQGC